MKKNEIKVGGFYVAVISGSITTVRVNNIRETYIHGKGYKTPVTFYDVINLSNNRKLTFRSAARFHSVAPEPVAPPEVLPAVKLLISVPAEDAEKLFWAINSGELEHLGITGAEYAFLEESKEADPITDASSGGDGKVE